MTETMDPRRLVAEQLAYLGMLQLHERRRSLADRAPWHDPRHGQGRVLALLKIKPEITQRELTYLLGMSRQSLAELLAKLEKQGLIEREASADDRRILIVRLTEAGQAADQGAAADPMIGALLSCLDDAEVTQLSDYLGRIIESMVASAGAEFEARRERFEEFLRERSGGPGEPESDPRDWAGGPGGWGGRAGGPEARAGGPRGRRGDPRGRAGGPGGWGGGPGGQGGGPRGREGDPRDWAGGPGEWGGDPGEWGGDRFPGAGPEPGPGPRRGHDHEHGHRHGHGPGHGPGPGHGRGRGDPEFADFQDFPGLLGYPWFPGFPGGSGDRLVPPPRDPDHTDED
ncbi:MAG: MarR family transcriptional regulator [Actinomycetia bacterium]|nr:MarR family transcriptional regulator [Actinomycetes bacterium]